MEAKLIVGGEAVEKRNLRNGKYIVGRGNKYFLCMWGPGLGDGGVIIGNPDSAIEREHLGIDVNSQTVGLRDIRTLNGSYLDGVRFVEEFLSQPGEYHIEIGNSELLLELTR